MVACIIREPRPNRWVPSLVDQSNARCALSLVPGLPHSFFPLRVLLPNWHVVSASSVLEEMRCNDSMQYLSSFFHPQAQDYGSPSTYQNCQHRLISVTFKIVCILDCD